jgi:hypothetical protein
VPSMAGDEGTFNAADYWGNEEGGHRLNGGNEGGGDASSCPCSGGSHGGGARPVTTATAPPLLGQRWKKKRGNGVLLGPKADWTSYFRGKKKQKKWVGLLWMLAEYRKRIGKMVFLNFGS